MTIVIGGGSYSASRVPFNPAPYMVKSNLPVSPDLPSL